MDILIKDAVRRGEKNSERETFKISIRCSVSPKSILYQNQNCPNDRILEFLDERDGHEAPSFPYFNSPEAYDDFNSDKHDAISSLISSNIVNVEHKNSTINSTVLMKDDTLTESSSYNSKSSVDTTQSTDDDTLINIPTSTQHTEEIKPTAIITGEGTVGKIVSQKECGLVHSNPNRFHKHSRLSFRQRLNKYIELSHEILSADYVLSTEAGAVVTANKDNVIQKTKDSSHKQQITCCDTTKTLHIPSAKALPTFHTNDERNAVLDHSGVSFCPLLEIYSISPYINTMREENINLSPFKLWGFKPFLQPRQNAFYKTKHTLVLDLDETLVSTSIEYIVDADAILTIQMPSTTQKQQSSNILCRKVLIEAEPTNTANRPKSDSYVLYIKYRPHLKEFLDFCFEYFEVVIFTASKKYYATAVLRRLQEDFGIQVVLPDDPLPGDHAQVSRTITLLHRDHCTPTNAGFVKDLFMLGRNLRTTVLVDNVAICGSFQPFNVIRVKDFVWRQLTYSKTKTSNGISRSDPCSQSLVGADIRKPFISAKLNVLSNRSMPDDDSDQFKVNCSTAIWNRFDDNVLRVLSGPEGVLRRMVYCSDVPRFLYQAMLRSVNAAGNVEENDLN
ncbi:unnamed protein product [Phytomonas sp. EM1]|nr:unnamed protein product [Phytomonas sp. EM1]|eukprot:CCW61440.1 unnamed protein product [Phytomonas sp. isolate EM1]